MAMCMIRKRRAFRPRRTWMAFRGHWPDCALCSISGAFLYASRDMMVYYTLVNAMAVAMVARVCAVMVMVHPMRRGRVAVRARGHGAC